MAAAGRAGLFLHPGRAAAEVSIGLALLLLLQRRSASLSVDDIAGMRG